MYGTVRTVVWEDGGREPPSYPIATVEDVASFVDGLAAPLWVAGDCWHFCWHSDGMLPEIGEVLEKPWWGERGKKRGKRDRRDAV